MTIFQSLMDGIKKTFAGAPYRIVLSMEERWVFLNSYKGNKSVPFNQLLNKHEGLSTLSNLIHKQGERIVIPLENLERVKMELSNLPSEEKNHPVDVQIPLEIRRLKLQSMTESFLIHYRWDDTEKAIIQSLQDCRAYFGYGWFVAQDGYWNISGLNENDELWLSEKIVRGKDVLELIGNIIPTWKNRGIPVNCEIRLGTEPAFKVKINSVSEDSVVCEIFWRVKTENIKEIPYLEGYIISDSTLVEGLDPSNFQIKLPLRSGSFYLKNGDIIVFRKEVLPRIRKWTEGNVDELHQKHNIIESTGELILSVVLKEQNGVGYAEVVPVFVCEGNRVNAEDISNLIQPQIKYIRMQSGWFPVEKLKLLGLGPMGRLIDGTSLNKNTRLFPGEILKKGSESFDGPWKRIEFPELRLPIDDNPVNIAYKHLEFLIKWGIPGGIIGTINEYENVIYGVFSSLIKSYPKGRVLIVGKKAVFDGLSEKWKGIFTGRYEGNKKDPEMKLNVSGIFSATPNALETYPGISQAKWDILLILEPDALVKSITSKLYQNLESCKARLVLGVFNGVEFFSHRQSFEALSNIFGIVDKELVWKYSLRNPRESKAVLPQPYKLKFKPIVNGNIQGSPAEFTIKSEMPYRSVPIPPRIEKKVQMPDNRSTGVTISFSVVENYRQGSYYSGSGSFVEEAKKLVGNIEHSAKFIPFMSYWPTYSSMSPQQQKWYFYWRSQVRKGLYPDTDLSYIFVHVYELINNVGVKNPMDGYQQLYNVWIYYRERFTKLDNYMVDWITDYVVLHQCDVNLLQIYEQMIKRNSYIFYPDLLLMSYNKSGLSKIPLALIDQLADYSVLRSKFYLEGNKALLEEYIVKTIEKVNMFLLEKHHLSILDFFKPGQTEKTQREPFRSAVHGYGSNRKITIETIPYSKHKPFRDFLTSVVKHTENKLRECKGYSGRLRGYILEPEIRACIENFLASEINGIEPSVKQAIKIEIDTAKVNRLLIDSDKVRDMLIVNGEENEKTAKEQQADIELVSGRIERPEGTPDHLLTDLEPVHRLLEILESQQLQIVKTLAESHWELMDSELLLSFPDIFLDPVIDSINEKALQCIGDLLIANENNKKVVTDDFRDELEFLLPQLKETKAEEVAKQKVEAAYIVLDLPEEWEQFRVDMKGYQIRVLAAILKGDDPISNINRLADENFMMPEMLIDSINEAALNNIGDMIIMLESFPPIINEEYLEMIEKIIA